MTKSLFAVLLAANALTGCAHLPGVPAPERMVETKVYQAPKPKVLPAKPQAEKPNQDPTYVDHAGTNWSVPAVQPKAVQAIATKPATLEITQPPTRAFRAYPVINSEDKVVDARFSPAVATATWEVNVQGAPVASKVKVTLCDQEGGSEVTEEVTPDELKWPAELAGTDKLTLPLNNRTVLTFLAQAPQATTMQVVVELEDAAGKPLADQDGKPFKLQLPVEVM